MKLYVWILLTGIFLGGCAAEETFETVSDVPVLSDMAQPGNISVSLPGEDAFPVVENDQSRIYLSEAYEIMLQTLPGGDMTETVLSLSGHTPEELTVMETFLDGVTRYEFVWAAAGERGDRVGRCVILDDGKYHYCLSALWDAESSATAQISWDQVFSSFTLV